MSDYVPQYVPISEDDPCLDLCLSLNYPASSKKYQSAPEEKKQEEEHKEVFSCTFCHREFKNPQALGGHQNSHRFERERMKNKEKERMGTIHGSVVNPPMQYPYATPPSMYGALNRPLAVNRSALIHKPYPSNSLRFGYGSQAMSYMLSPQHYPLVPNGVQSWPPSVEFGVGDPNYGFRTWINPNDFTSEGSSSQTFLRSDEGASGSYGGGDAGNGGSFSY